MSGMRAVDADQYVLLKRRIAARGLLERHPWRQAPSAAALGALLAGVVALLVLGRGSWWTLALAAPAAFLFGQIGFLAHGAAHNQVLKSSGANYVASLVLFNLGLGGSRGWWADKHTTHHAQPNRIGTDPDIEGGIVAITGEQARRSRGFERFMIGHQRTTIAPLLSLSVLQIHVYSAGFIIRGRLRHPFAEVLLFIAHYVLYLGGLMLLLGAGRGLLFALIHQLLLGVYLGGAFLPNHVGMPLLERGDPMDFLHRQVLTSRNISGGTLVDVLFGSLSVQIEHHLFPAMPSYNLRAAAPIVRRFCEERGIAYRETTTLEAYRQVLRHLVAMARLTGRPAAARAAG